jgi:hypothetical protein
MSVRASFAWDSTSGAEASTANWEFLLTPAGSGIYGEMLVAAAGYVSHSRC